MKTKCKTRLTSALQCGYKSIIFVKFKFKESCPDIVSSGRLMYRTVGPRTGQYIIMIIIMDLKIKLNHRVDTENGF